MTGPPLTLATATAAHLLQMMAWFPTEQTCQIWGGVNFRFPFTPITFAQDSSIDQLPSYVLLDASRALRAFGQCSLRYSRCHLGRLAIAPSHRGQGIGTQWVRALAARGFSDLGVSECSLFVSPSNPRARALYERLGFRVVPFPDKKFDASPYDYMIAGAAVLARRAESQIT
jgi:ribosomal protein S18 acetylase RimI-like enzyme